MGLQDLIIESNSLLLIQAIKGTRISKSLLGNIIKDIQELMRIFPKCQIQQVGRMGNSAAHSLARYVCNIDNTNFLWEFYPTFISQIVWIDNHL